MSTFDPNEFARSFVLTFTARMQEPETAERCEALHKVLTSVIYGYFQLWYGVAKDIAFQQAASDRTLDGAVQVVEENGQLRLYEGRDNEPEGVFPVLRYYKKPGTENRRDREGNLTSRSEFDNDALWVGLYQPLWKALKEQFDQRYLSKLQSLNTMFQQHGIKGTAEQLDFLINELLDEAIAMFGNATIRGLRVIDRAKRSSETFEELSDEDKRMRMRGLLITLNEEALERRRNRRGTMPASRADTMAGQVYRSQLNRNGSSPPPPVKRSQGAQPQENGPHPSVPVGQPAGSGVSADFFKPYGGASVGAPGAAPGAVAPGSGRVSAPGAPIPPGGTSAPSNGHHTGTLTGVRRFDPSLLASLPPEELEPIPQGGVSFYGGLDDLEQMEAEGLIY